MKIGIHNTQGTFSDRWIQYCDSQGIPYKLVNCFRNDIIEQLADCDGLMWHFNHKGSKESKFAKELLFSLQTGGKIVFPDFNTAWHFDDKIGQKYLLEALRVSLAPTYVFYSMKEALAWSETTVFPKVFKLRNGSGSDNVRLVKRRDDAVRLIRKAFRSGFAQYNSIGNLKERIRKYGIGKTDILDVMKGVARMVYPTKYSRMTGREIGYVYFQDFIPNNSYDIRVIVIGDKAFAIKRMVRDNDFRASGSGSILYEKEHLPQETVKLAFRISEKLKDQCMAYDFVYQEGNPLVVEVSYGFDMKGYDSCVGYWDKSMTWHDGDFNPYGWMVDDFVRRVELGAMSRS